MYKKSSIIKEAKQVMSPDTKKTINKNKKENKKLKKTQNQNILKKMQGRN